MKIKSIATISAALSALLIFVSCGYDWSVKTNSYVLSYETLRGINALSFQESNLNVIRITWASNGLIGAADSRDPKERATFDAICEKYGDTSYNRTLSANVEHNNYYRNYYAEDFSSIDITSDSGFDENHPAGSSLNDIFHFVGASPYQYIQRKYTDEFDWDGYKEFSSVYKILLNLFPTSITWDNPTDPIDKRVDMLVPDDLKLLQFPYINVVCYLVCMAEPTLDTTHTFTITFNGTDGKQYTTSAVIEF